MCVFLMLLQTNSLPLPGCHLSTGKKGHVNDTHILGTVTYKHWELGTNQNCPTAPKKQTMLLNTEP